MTFLFLNLILLQAADRAWRASRRQCGGNILDFRSASWGLQTNLGLLVFYRHRGLRMSIWFFCCWFCHCFSPIFKTKNKIKTICDIKILWNSTFGIHKVLLKHGPTHIQHPEHGCFCATSAELTVELDHVFHGGSNIYDLILGGKMSWSFVRVSWGSNMLGKEHYTVIENSCVYMVNICIGKNKANLNAIHLTSVPVGSHHAKSILCLLSSLLCLSYLELCQPWYMLSKCLFKEWMITTQASREQQKKRFIDLVV